ncbi:hypothetical protein [Neorickettsia sennetsu]|uniref:Uncharacterized protein n=1 Tax=Ehrlichia sennetsu (strain ATCC VR-367 / Miyayama) TaxID=222891 RepID=Q2GE79_EHRS3|nr:hypothetical protein [Neorickettsia sennetsu]ABD46165.1 hypothetical protein NSE_0328 [Neorickettsia sennetsu str. Miyayama]
MQGKIGRFALAAARMSRNIGGAVLNTGKAVLLATPRKMKLGIAERFGDLISGAKEWEVLHKANTNRFTKTALGADWTSHTKTLDGAKDVEFSVPRALVPQDSIHALEGYLNAIASGEGIAEAREKNKGNHLYLLHAEFVALGGGVEIRENGKNNQAELVIKIPLCASKAEFQERVAKAIKAAGIEDSCSVREATERLWKRKDVDFGKSTSSTQCDHEHNHHPSKPENQYNPVSNAGLNMAKSMPELREMEKQTPVTPTRSQSTSDLRSAILAMRLKPIATQEKSAVIDAANSLVELLRYRDLEVCGGLTDVDLCKLRSVAIEMRSTGSLDLSDSQRGCLPEGLGAKLHAFKAGCDQKIADLERGEQNLPGSSVDPLPSAVVEEIRGYKSAGRAAENLVFAIAALPALASHLGVAPVQSPFKSSLAGALLNAASGIPISGVDETQGLQHAPSHTPENMEHAVHGQGK